MHATIDELKHHHRFQSDTRGAERKALVVFLLTVATMGVEIIIGWLSRSMALFAVYRSRLARLGELAHVTIEIHAVRR